jgi:hypothetical protein
MSEKWRRSKAWDEQHIPPALWPVRWVLRAFSSITLAVILLSTVVLYGISASVPIGLIALIPTMLLYGLSVVGVIGLVAVPVVWLALRATRRAGRGARFAAVFLSLLVLVPVGGLLWYRFAWPVLHYDPATGHGLRLFAGFVEAYSATTLRRLPGMEMSELEYYSWWPLRVVLLLFVMNMVVATVRRIDFTFRNIGVLTVHSGIILIALGSVYYSGLKLEGDTILLAGAVEPTSGKPGAGPSQATFYDNTRIALYVGQGGRWEQRLLRGVPRYNDYNLGAASGVTAQEATGRLKAVLPPSRPALNIDVPRTQFDVAGEDVSFRVVGYASYAEPWPDWERVEGSLPEERSPLRFVYLHSAKHENGADVLGDPVFAFTLPPRIPAERSTGNGLFSVEYTLGADAGMPESRWRDLAETLPPDTTHALVVEIPATGVREVHAVRAGQELTVGGYTLAVNQLLPTPPFPIITPGYRGATSAVAVVGVKTPAGETFERYVYHRFPEINQDMLAQLNERGMPTRRDADPAIRIGLVQSDQLYLYFDERPDGSVRAIVRQPGGELRIVEQIGADGVLPRVVPQMMEEDPIITMRVGERWDDSRRIERPRPVPEEEQTKAEIGTHEHAMLGVEVRVADGAGGGEPWKRIVWLPFSRYVGAVGDGDDRPVTLPDGRTLSLAFGRLQHQLPGFEVQLVDFQMIAYDHRGAPRDYQSVLRVIPVDSGFEAYEHVTKLNAPLTAPYIWTESRPWISNVFGRLSAGLDPRQFKFSQAGWDASGWEQSQAQTDAGMIPRPFAKFTILGVGNNPGIHIIALGAVLMGVGIPWAFYLKPYLVKREKLRIQRELAAGTYRKPQRAPVAVQTVRSSS